MRLLHKGASKWDTNIYRVNVIDTEAVPTIYTLAKDYRLRKQGELEQPIHTESVAEGTDSMGIAEPPPPILCESKDIEFDFDSSNFFLRQGNSSGFAAVSEHLEENKKNQNQNQNRNGSGLAGTETRGQEPSATQTAEKRQANTNTNTGSTPPGSAAPPKRLRTFTEELNECEHCFQTMDNHHKNCPTLREVQYA